MEGFLDEDTAEDSGGGGSQGREWSQGHGETVRLLAGGLESIWEAVGISWAQVSHLPGSPAPESARNMWSQ